MKTQDIKEIKTFTDIFDKTFKKKLGAKVYSRNEFREYLGRGAETIYTTPIPKGFKETKWRKNPKEGMLWIETDINPNGITSKEDIGRTYTIKFEQTCEERRKYARSWNWNSGTINHFYAYGRSIEEVVEKFLDFLDSNKYNQL